MLSNQQLNIASFYNISIDTIKKLVPNGFDKQKYVLLYQNLQLYRKLGLKLKNLIVYQNSVSQTKTICWTQHKKKTEAKKNANMEKRRRD